MAEYYGDIECYQLQDDGTLVPVLDTHHAVLGVIVEKGKKKARCFDLRTNPDSMWEFILYEIDTEHARGHEATFWFHNAQYDWSAIARNHHTDTQIKIVCHKPFILTITRPNGGVGNVYDSMALFARYSIEDLGKLTGTHKLPMPKVITHPDQLKAYCEQDCRVIESAMTLLKATLKTLDYNARKLLTVSKTAHNLLNHINSNEYYTKPNGTRIPKAVFWWNNGRIAHPTQYPLLWKAVSRGARFEAYSWGAPVEHCYQLDINSAYPFVCVANQFPDIITEKYHENPTLDIIKKIGMSEALIKVPNIAIPYLPIKLPSKTVIYPWSTQTQSCLIQGFWTHYELEQAQKYGYQILEITRSVTYDPLPFNMFESYVNKLYPIKKDKKNPMSGMAKLLLNSMTGRFAQQRKPDVETKIIQRSSIFHSPSSVPILK